MENNYLYGLTIQGIQSYIFETNKLKEIIGASEIIEKLCTITFSEKKYQGESLLNAAGNIRFITDKDTVKTIFKEYHSILLKKAPSVPFSQAVVEIKGNNIKEALKDLDAKLRGHRNVPQHYISLGNMARTKYNRTGNFTSTHKHNEEGKNIDISTYKKLKKWKSEILTNKIDLNNKYTFPTEFKQLTAGGKDHWLALIHIDGNGMGNIIQEILKSKAIDKLKEFSENVDIATTKAFKTAITKTFIDNDTPEKEGFLEDKDKNIILPLRPLVLGGDDVSIIMRADFAIDFTKTFLSEFEDNTKNIVEGEKLTACAGIAYVKEKFPFHYSAQMAEELCKYAKDQSERKHSCLQFHKVQDSIFEDYKDIQKRELKTSNSLDVAFITKPYYLHSIEDTDKKVITIDNLKDTIKKLSEEDAPRNKIREWVDACFNNPLMAVEMKDRIKDLKEYLPNNNEAINYLTQLAITK